MKIGLTAIAVAIVSVGQVHGQTTGVSRPEQIPMTTGSEAIQQPGVYEAPASVPAKPSAALKMRTPQPSADTDARRSSESAPAPEIAHAGTRPSERPRDVDGMIVGDDVRGLVPPETDADIVTRVAGPPNQLPVGTMMKVSMAQALRTRETQEGSEFTAELTEPVLRDGRVLLPAGSVMSGRVTDVHGGRRITGAASIHLQPMAITLPDGTKYKMHGQVIDTSLYKHVKVDSEGTISRRDHKMATAGALGLTTGSGAAAGAVFGGWPGAIIGGVVGAGVGTAVWLKQDRQEELPAGTKMVFSLTSPLAVGIE